MVAATAGATAWVRYGAFRPREAYRDIMDWLDLDDVGTIVYVRSVCRL